MAQALFDDHPLEEYLRGAGELPILMPGISAELEREIDPYFDFFDELDEQSLEEWCPQFVVDLLEILHSILSSFQSSKTPNSFVERFKYNVISSSLLATSLPTPAPGRTLRTPSSIPGKLEHSSASSVDFGRPISPQTAPDAHPDNSYGSLSFSMACIALFFSMGYPFLTFLSFIATAYLFHHSFQLTDTPKHGMTYSFNALAELEAANDSWEHVVQDALRFLDNQERSQMHSPYGLSSPSPIRVALHSCLQTTHTQCDNIRHLFSALTSPADLSQISEMYAPPSPTKQTFTLEENSRRFSFVSQRLVKSPSVTPMPRENKRSTWNGSYASLVYSGSPISPLARRRDRRRTNASDIFQTGISSAPTTPMMHTSDASLSEVAEDLSEEDDEQQIEVHPSKSPETFHFGAAALELQRNRKSGGLEAFQEPNIFTSNPRTPRSGHDSIFSATFSSSSKFTNPKSARHHLSHSSLQQTLQGTLAAKRYTCSHLLALRFLDDEDEGYWEDVRSVVGLLSSALADCYSRLSAALEEAEQQNIRDQNPTPATAVFDLPAETMLDSIAEVGHQRRSTNRISFAPMPNHISRFATHVATISSALEDARDNLEQCVSALRSEPVPSAGSPLSKRRRNPKSTGTSPSMGSKAEEEGEEMHVAVQAYERLRRELGLALREVERGRERLLELVNPPEEQSDSEDDYDDLPSLRHDGSDDSDKQEQASPSDDEGELHPSSTADSQFSPDIDGSPGAPVDDATLDLLLATSSENLPVAGVEEVYEADTGAEAGFKRERSTLSREERIKIAKARREASKGLSLATTAKGPGSADEEASITRIGVEKWGPGGDVVQELKDMIWKVGEKKRKMLNTVQAQAESHSTVIPPVSLENT